MSTISFRKTFVPPVSIPIYVSNSSANYSTVTLPRYVRVNELYTDVATVVKQFEQQGYTMITADSADAEILRSRVVNTITNRENKTKEVKKKCVHHKRSFVQVWLTTVITEWWWSTKTLAPFWCSRQWLTCTTMLCWRQDTSSCKIKYVWNLFRSFGWHVSFAG